MPLHQLLFVVFSYTLKNLVEVLILIIFIGINGYFIYDSYNKNIKPSKCSVQLMNVPDLDITNGTAHFQCEVKKVGFFLSLTSLGVMAQGMVLLCSVGSLIWYAFGRSVSKILRTLKTSPKFSADYGKILDAEENKDFWFLMDLIAHSSGSKLIILNIF